MPKFIYTPIDMREKMLALGYKELTFCNIKNEKYVIFDNINTNRSNVNFSVNFSVEETKKIIFTSKLYFV